MQWLEGFCLEWTNCQKSPGMHFHLDKQSPENQVNLCIVETKSAIGTILPLRDSRVFDD